MIRQNWDDTEHLNYLLLLLPSKLWYLEHWIYNLRVIKLNKTYALNKSGGRFQRLQNSLVSFV